MTALLDAAWNWATSWTAFLVAVFGFWWRFLQNPLSNPADRRRIAGWLVSGSLTARYRRLLRRALAWIDRLASRDEIAAGRGEAAVAWSGGLLGFTLLVAYLYPIGTLTLQWVAYGGGDIAGMPVLPEQPAAWRRQATVGGLLVAVVAVILASRQASLRGRVVCAAVALVAAGGATAANGFAVESGEIGLNNPFWGWAFDLLEVGSGTAANFVVVSATVILAILYASLARESWRIPAGMVIVLSVAASVNGTGGGNLERIGGALVAAAAFSLLYNVRGASARNVALTLVACGLATAVAMVLLSEHLVALGNLVPGSSVVVFLGFLPLLNAIADFLSIGLTRYLLARGLETGIHRSALIDLLAALAIFTSLGAAIVTYLHLVRPRSGQPMFDVGASLEAIRADPGAHWWLGFMLFSTLIPTLLHLAVFLAALWSWWPFALRRWVAGLLHLGAGEEGSALAGQTGALILAFMLTLSVFVPVFAILEGVRHAPWLVDLVIDGFAGFAWLIGAV